MKTTIFRVSGVVVGLVMATGAIVLPLLIISSEFQGPDPPGRIAAISFLVLLLAACFAVVAYSLLRYSFRRG